VTPRDRFSRSRAGRLLLVAHIVETRALAALSHHTELTSLLVAPRRQQLRRRGLIFPGCAWQDNGLMPIALSLILLSIGYRLVGAWNPELANFSPLMALAFCSAVYFRSRWLWLVPFAALSLSDLYLNHYYLTQYGYGWTGGAALVRTACFAAAIGLGLLVARRKSWLNLFSGALGGAVIFYLATNTTAWWVEPAYAKSVAGWWQAMTVGLPQYAPTLLFFRNTLTSDLLFTGIFVLTMESLALRRHEPSLLAPAVAAPAV
jgi:hypothetical protein